MRGITSWGSRKRRRDGRRLLGFRGHDPGARYRLRYSGCTTRGFSFATRWFFAPLGFVKGNFLGRSVSIHGKQFFFRIETQGAELVGRFFSKRNPFALLRLLVEDRKIINLAQLEKPSHFNFAGNCRGGNRFSSWRGNCWRFFRGTGTRRLER